jgi:hypothetical protein
MRNQIRQLVCAITLVAGARLTATPVKFRYAGHPIANSYIVVLHRQTAAQDVHGISARLAKGKNGHVTAEITHGIHAFGFHGSEAAAKALSNNPEVAWVEQDGWVEPSSNPSCTSNVCQYSPVSTSQITPCFPASAHTDWNCDDDHWNVDRIDNGGPINPSDRSYGWTYTGAGVKAYVVDFGVRGTHAELSGRVTVGANMMMDSALGDNPNITNCYNNSPNNCEQVLPLDGYYPNNPCGGSVAFESVASHGTSVASVLAGSTLGVARGATIVPVKVGSCDGQVSLLAVARGLSWIIHDVATNPGPAVVNISLRFVLGYPDNTSNVVCETGQDRDGDGVIDNDIGDYMNCMYRTITVGGTMYQIQNGVYSDDTWTCDATRDTVAGSLYTSCNRNTGSNYGPSVSIWAPAWNVKVADASSDTAIRTPGIASSGSSFAAPAVAGAVARLLQQHPSWTVDQIWQKLRDDADAHSSGNPDFDLGANVNRRLLFVGRGD